MGTVQKLAEKAKAGLQTALPKLRQAVINKLALAVGAMLEAQTPNTSELSNVLPLPTDQQGIREQWLRWLLKNPRLVSPDILEPFARAVLREAAWNGQTVLLSLDQTDLGDRFAVLMLAIRVGDRSLPLAWWVEAGAANIGFAGQQVLLERVRAWLPTVASVVAGVRGWVNYHAVSDNQKTVSSFLEESNQFWHFRHRRKTELFWSRIIHGRPRFASAEALLAYS